jgi:plastocyanin
MRRIVLLILIAFSTVLISCKKDNAGVGNNNNNNNNSANNHIDMKDSKFDPGELTITVGESVKWENKDSYAHTVTADNGNFDSGDVPAGGEYSHTFSTVGTYSYYCIYHSGMTGKIIVK